ncbi:MAG TPA: hypothetical protein VK422_02990 [Pyrinomonadaceae bacterium]|nr:hypothetical protein [Pyrinomonadaceae bacterium]
MSPNSTDFSLQALEARFEMQCMDNHDTSGYYMEEQIGGNDCGGGGGGYGYYGNSWDNLGSGDAYAGPYQEASDGSGAMLDDGSYTDGSSGQFPGYDTRATTQSIQQPDGSCWPTYPCSPRSLCRICRC